MSDGLERLGVTTLRDLLYFFPRAHYDYKDTRTISRMRFGEKTTLVGTIENVRTTRTHRGMAITTVTIADDSGTVAVRWFNQPYLAKTLHVKARIAISGEPTVFNGHVTFQPRDYELIQAADLTHTARLVPMYPLTQGLYQRSLRQLVKRVVDDYADAVDDFVPDDVRAHIKMPDLASAIRRFHFPESEEARSLAQSRLAFDELLLIQLGLLMRKHQWQEYDAELAVTVDNTVAQQFQDSLPFALTNAQSRVLAEIFEDMGKPVPMSRLLQGDVGSGKTVVAAAALLQIARAGKQGVLMAPTEILAEQHYRSLQNMLAPLELRCELLTGSTARTRRQEILKVTADGSVNILVGTHALIQDTVTFAHLGLAITDEQHRFGVEQRAALRQKGMHPHTLAMTATPIPRTLAITIYGDLDVSAIDEMPPGRQPVVTTWARTPAEAYGVVRDEVRKGHQAFVICPVIQESIDSDMRSVIAEHKELETLVFPQYRVGLLHGRMKAKDKEATLDAFRRGDLHILVATSVIEVGIDIPNATVMVIRDAHRFGLAQLHQFRGRVGRGGEQAFCVLLSPTEGDVSRERLEALTAMDDGFKLAEEDLRLRGPGEFWGTRQSGLPQLRVATLGDVPTIERARTTARRLLHDDPMLEAPRHAALLQHVRDFWSESADWS
ncbi:MAG: ATP-dependent DNA helicase RecG [Chloroflexota bacterium]